MQTYWRISNIRADSKSPGETCVNSSNIFHFHPLHQLTSSQLQERSRLDKPWPAVCSILRVAIELNWFSFFNTMVVKAVGVCCRGGCLNWTEFCRKNFVAVASVPWTSKGLILKCLKIGALQLFKFCKLCHTVGRVLWLQNMFCLSLLRFSLHHRHSHMKCTAHRDYGNVWDFP